MASPFPQLTGQDEERELVNAAFEAIDHVAVYAKADLTTSGLVWGYYGGRWGGFAVAAGTFTLTNASANYLVAAVSTGVTTASTATTNWNDSANYRRIYKVTTAGGVVTAVEDHRAGPNGILGPGASGGDASTNTATSVDSEVVLFSSTTGKLLKRATGTGLAKLTSGVQSVVPQSMAICIACSDETTLLTAGTAKATFRMPFAFTLSDVRASVTEAPTGGTLLAVDVNESGTTILSTKLTFDATEKTTTTAATPRVISDSSLADDAEMTVDIDAIGSTLAGKGLKVYLIGWPT